MMSTLRKNTAMVLWILVIAFIATIIFSWGMGGFQGSIEPGVIAKVNGQKITRDQFDQAIQNEFAFERQQNPGAQIGDARAAQIREEVWNSTIAEILLEHAPVGGWPRVPSGVLDARTAWVFVLNAAMPDPA